jgi:hypothetical protein
MRIAGDEKRQVMLRTPRGIAHDFKVSCMVSALLVAGTTTPIIGSSRISRMELEWGSC